MFKKRPAIRAVTAALITLCYLGLAGMSAIHEVTHLADALRQFVAAGNTPTASDTHGRGIDDGRASLPCFLCLNGHPYSVLSYSPYTADLITTETAERIVAVPELVSSLYRLPSLRAPPSFC